MNDFTSTRLKSCIRIPLTDYTIFVSMKLPTMRKVLFWIMTYFMKIKRWHWILFFQTGNMYAMFEVEDLVYYNYSYRGEKSKPPDKIVGVACIISYIKYDYRNQRENQLGRHLWKHHIVQASAQNEAKVTYLILPTLRTQQVRGCSPVPLQQVSPGSPEVPLEILHTPYSNLLLVQAEASFTSSQSPLSTICPSSFLACVLPGRTLEYLLQGFADLLSNSPFCFSAELLGHH